MYFVKRKGIVHRKINLEVEVRRKCKFLMYGRPSLDHPASTPNTLRGGAGLGEASCFSGATSGFITAKKTPLLRIEK
ncbi:hypothetical protein PUN28_004858 [Cardiocondyla obscurior]|uniref:Ribosomal protein L16 n=1 Tax=Cardiocondyla obscurior TaxID=286306 RepID=A0AAW2GIV6_9HYME